MDDSNIPVLNESKNEWGIYLLNVLTPLIIEGINTIFVEADRSCTSQKESSKYLLTFQNFISCIPKWNQSIVDKECARIIEKSKCNYLEELVACVHVIQLKILTAVRVSSVQKKVDIKIPKLSDFIHLVYINVARKVYKNTYLFSKSVSAIQAQKHRRDLEVIVQECILNTIRESIPIETILKVYVDETTDEIVTEVDAPKEIGGGAHPPTPPPTYIPPTPPAAPVAPEPNTHLSFDDIDTAIDDMQRQTNIIAPKTDERLNQISADRFAKEKENDDDDDDDDDVKIQLTDQNIDITDDIVDFDSLNPTKPDNLSNAMFDDFEVLT